LICSLRRSAWKSGKHREPGWASSWPLSLFFYSDGRQRRDWN